MTLTRLDKAPFPWFGGKTHAAPAVWAALGDVAHYVEPFAGSLAVLLRRPHPANRPYHSETVNDADGLLVNAWRAIQLSPQETACHASWPVAEADLHARHLALVRWRENTSLERLMADPGWHDPRMAGWWLWGVSCWIGGGWCAGSGAWTERDGVFVRQNPRVREPGVDRQRPHLTGCQGVNHAGVREPGVERKLPHLGDDGRGVNHTGVREPGVSRRLPHLTGGGQGVNRPGVREPGVSRKLPHLVNNGQGVNHTGVREPGVSRRLPHLTGGGRGVNRPGVREPGVADATPEPHPMTMPELVRWFAWLSARLRHVRILNGDWARTVTSGASLTIPVRHGDGPCGVFLDPPYADTAGRTANVYARDCLQVAHAAREWAVAHGDDARYRIVLAGFDTEHTMPDTWRTVEWFRAGYLTGGMGNVGGDGHQQHRERLWLSPHCLTGAVDPTQEALFA